MDPARFSHRGAIDGFLVAAGFFTRLPFPYPSQAPRLAEAIWAAPLAGVVVGLACGVAGGLATALGLPPHLAAVVALAAGILVTGALHEDGAADLADGFGGGRTREAKLEIMRDSRIGSYGALALIVSTLARWAAYAAILGAASGIVALWIAVAVHAGSRAVIPAFMARVPSARSDGLSAGAGAVADRTAFVALAIGAIVALPLGFGFLAAAVLVVAVVTSGVAVLCRRQIGGQTGDVLGALQQLCETGLLFVAAAILI